MALSDEVRDGIVRNGILGIESNTANHLNHLPLELRRRVPVLGNSSQGTRSSEGSSDSRQTPSPFRLYKTFFFFFSIIIILKFDFIL